MTGGSFQDAVRRRQAVGFVARADELGRFRANLALPADDPDRRFIFNVYGDGGVGKTFLSQRLRGIADAHGALTSWIDERVSGVPDVLRAMAADLSRAGEDMSAFNKLLGNYLSRRNEVEADPDAPAGAAAFITKTAVRVGLHAAHAVPGLGGVADSIDGDAAAEQADRLRTFLGKKFHSHEDVRLLMSPAEALTPAFTDALVKAKKRGKTLALFFDTYEQTGTFLDGWLRSVLDGRYGDLPEDLVVTIAGRHPLDPGDWSHYASVLADVPLVPFTETEARQLLVARGVTDEGVVQVILNVSGRLPLLVAMLAEKQPTDPGQVGDPSGDAVERFLKWETDTDRQSLAVAAALPRAVNEDVLGVLVGGRDLDEAGRSQLFAWLRSLPFVHRDAGRCVYHEVVRTAMIRLERGQSPSRWRERHTALARAYRQWRADSFTEDSWDDPGWLADRLEEAYHSLCADPAGELYSALAELPAALELGRTTASKWAQMLLQAGADRDAAAVLTWGRRLEEALRGSDDEAQVACLTLLLRDYRLTGKAKIDALRTRGRALYFLDRDDEAIADLTAALEVDPADTRTLCFRGDCYQWLGRSADALADYDQVIELDPDYSYGFGSRGRTYLRLGRRDEAISDFSRAIELDPDYRWAIASRGQVYRQAGQYDRAITDYNRAIELDPTYTWAIAQRGETYRVAGKYPQALSDFDRAIEFNPDYAWAIASRGQTYGQSHQYDRAITDYNRAIELDPSYAWAIARRAEIYRLTGDYQQAISGFSQAIKLAPDDAVALVGRGQSYRETRQYDQAIKDLNRAIELEPGEGWCFYERFLVFTCLGRSDEASGDFAAAVSRVSSALATDSADPIDAYNLAVFRAAAGDYQQASIDIAQAIERSPCESSMHEAIDDLRELGGIPGTDPARIARLTEQLQRALAALNGDRGQ